jgi:cholesterol transport system auxiliary component
LKKVLVIGFSAVLASTLGACNVLKPTANQQISIYALNSSLSASVTAAAPPVVASAPTIIVNPPQAAAGFETAKIIYLRQRHLIEYYSQSEWVAPPAKMLVPLIVESLSRDGSFKAVVTAPSAVVADLRLNTEIVRLQQEFLDNGGPSRVRLTLRAYIMDEKTRKVLAVREFDTVVDSVSENVAGGVLAANLATEQVLKNLAALAASVAIATNANRASVTK